jgi:uncharacterized protein (TIGR02231 family)
MQRLLFALVITLSFFKSQAQADKKPLTTNAAITHANIYYGYGAELSHKAKLNIPAGQNEIIINNVSTTLLENTLQIGCPENVVLLNYRFNIKTETPTIVVNPLFKKMEDSIKIYQKQITANHQEASITEEMLSKTSKLIETYSAVPEKTINTADVMKLIEFYNGKIQTYRTSLFASKQKREEWQEEINAINQRIYDLRQKEKLPPSKSIGQLILQVLTKESTDADIMLSYYTQNAGWVPTYDMRVKSIDNTFKLAYKASISQTTGLDWKQVKLTLSTSNPNQGTTIPILNPWQLQYFVPEVYRQMQNAKAASMNGYMYNRAQSMDETVVIGYETAKKKEFAGANAKIDASDISAYTTLNESQLFTSFDIDLPYDVPTDGRSYSVAIKEEKINASYKHYAIPKLDRDAFLLAEISDWENLDLLPGEANVIMDNVYLGKSFIDPNTTMDTLNISLGRDKRVAIKRLLMKENSKTKFIGNNKTETFTYEITVKNNKKETMNLLLKDQYPLSSIKEIEVELVSSDDAEVNAELGSLNWKVTMKPGESRKFRFTYKVTYPKDKKIANLR